MTAGRFAVGDPLRAVAALSVLVYHVAFTSLLLTGGVRASGQFEEVYGRWPGRVLGNLDLGLFLFFVLSGYLLTRPFVAGRPDLRRYVRNRILRIVPAFWVVALATLIYFGPRGATAWEVLSVPAFVQSYVPNPFAQVYGQAWTLDVEMGFYLLLPFIALALPRRLAVLAAAFVLIGVVSLALRAWVPEDERYLRALPMMLFAFVPGMLLAVAEPLLRPPAWTSWLALLGAAVCFLVYLEIPRDAPALRGLVACALAGLVVAAPLLWQWSGRPPWRLLDTRAAHWLGARSYGIYLVHNGLLIALMPHLEIAGEGAKVLFAVALLPVLAGTLLLSDLLHRFVERPALALRR